MQARTSLPSADGRGPSNSGDLQPNAGHCLFFNFGMLFALLRVSGRTEQDGPMEPKIALLFLLIACVIGLSHLNDEVVGRVRRQLSEGRWREILPRRRRV
jgi:hypothetical protein